MSSSTNRALRAWLRRARMASLLLADAPTGREAAAVVEWFGAMQAQDLASTMWSLGLRTGTSREAVAHALADGRIVRTWPMRGTLHLVPGRDARWMVRHFAQRSLQQAAGRRAALGFDEAVAERACEVLAGFLAESPVSRGDCLAALSEAGIDTGGQRGYHLLWYAAARGLVCVGPNRGREQTFVLMDRWAPLGPAPDRPEALALLAGRFVRSHGPVTVHDLARWADLTVTDARSAIVEAPGIVERLVDGQRMLLTDELLELVGPPPERSASKAGSGAPAASVRDPIGAPAATPGGRRRLPARALPGFDEFVLGYRDRSAQLDRGHEQLVVPGGNGVFQPTLVLDGRVVGTWRRRELARRVVVEAIPFEEVGSSAKASLERALVDFGRYLGLPCETRWRS